jgi:hypothetical protein
MSETVSQRIADRTARADERLKEQGFIGRTMNRIGLTMANTSDRVASIVHNDTTAFIGGAVKGALRGGVLGGVTWAFLVAAEVVVAGLPTFLAIAGVAAAGFALYHGRDAMRQFENSKATNEKSAGDRIAEASGATYDRKLTEPLVEVSEQPTQSHVQRESARRVTAAQVAAARQTHAHH